MDFRLYCSSGASRHRLKIDATSALAKRRCTCARQSNGTENTADPQRETAQRIEHPPYRAPPHSAHTKSPIAALLPRYMHHKSERVQPEATAHHTPCNPLERTSLQDHLRPPEPPCPDYAAHATPRATPPPHQVVHRAEPQRYLRAHCHTSIR